MFGARCGTCEPPDGFQLPTCRRETRSHNHWLKSTDSERSFEIAPEVVRYMRSPAYLSPLVETRASGSSANPARAKRLLADVSSDWKRRRAGPSELTESMRVTSQRCRERNEFASGGRYR